MLLFDGRRQHHDLACAARHQRKPSLRCAHAGQRPKRPAKPPDLYPQPCAMRIHRRASRGRPVRRAWPAEHLRATPRPARVRARTAPGALRARPPCVRHARHSGTHPRRAPSTPAALQHPRAGEVARSPRAIRRAAGVFSTSDALSTSAVSAGISACARGALGPSERSARRLRPKAAHRDSRNHQFVGGPQRGREGRGVELGERAARLRQGGRSGAGAGLRDSEHVRRSTRSPCA